MKKSIYIALFIFLGFLLQLVLHGWIELWYIELLTSDFERYDLGLNWNAWFLIHHIGSIIFVVLGIWFGWRQGRYWWERVYVKKDVWFQK